VGHKYNNFADAFSAFAGGYNDAKQYLTWGYNNIWAGYNDWADPVTKPQVYKIVSGISNVISSLHYLMGTPASQWEDAWLYECFYWLQQETGDLTMAAILDAMSKAEPHEPLLFVGYLEAFKASAWNATFDETFFADLVKKWAIWG